MVKTENLCMNDFDNVMERRSLSKGSKSKSKTRIKTYRNPFLNFISDFRKSNAGLKGSEIIQKAAERWRNMNQNEKSPYCEQAKNAPKRRKKKQTSSYRKTRSRKG